MEFKRVLAGGTAVALAATVGVGAFSTASANAAGDRSLATVLTSDGNKFDKNGHDFDVVTEAVLAVLAAKPDSAVGMLTDGDVKLTAFAPTDKAFKILASELTGTKVRSERKALSTVAGLGIDTVETALLYHVVAGAKIPAKAAVKADGAKLETAQGGTIRVKVATKGHSVSIVLRDKDPNSRNAKVVASLVDINKGNKQIAHGIDRVLRPVDLAPTAS
jgi:uncharacterized surface protein with fasciclin (FAS1) repeats